MPEIPILGISVAGQLFGGVWDSNDVKVTNPCRLSSSGAVFNCFPNQRAGVIVDVNNDHFMGRTIMDATTAAAYNSWAQGLPSS